MQRVKIDTRSSNRHCVDVTVGVTILKMIKNVTIKTIWADGNVNEKNEISLARDVYVCAIICLCNV